MFLFWQGWLSYPEAAYAAWGSTLVWRHPRRSAPCIWQNIRLKWADGRVAVRRGNPGP